MSLPIISPHSNLKTITTGDLENGKEQQVVNKGDKLTQNLFVRNEWRSHTNQPLGLGKRQVDPLVSNSDSKNGSFEVMDIETGEILETVDADEGDQNSQAGALTNYKSAGPMAARTLSTLTNSRTLGLYKNQLSDISYLAPLKKLTPLVLSNNNLSDVSCLESLTNLPMQELSNNKPSDVSCLYLVPMEKEKFKTKAISSNSILSGMDEALARFQLHPVYQRLFTHGIFSSEDSMKSFYTNAVLRGTCDSQIEEMCRLLDVDAELDSRELMLNVNPANVCFNQIVSFTEIEIAIVIAKEESSGTLSQDRKNSLLLMIEFLQTSLPHQRSFSLNFKPSENLTNYKIIYKAFMNDQKFSNYSPYGRILIQNIEKNDSNGSTKENHAVFFQDLKTRGIFRFYEPNDGFRELTEDEFFKTLKEHTFPKYDDDMYAEEPSVCFSIDTNEIDYPASSPLAKLYKLVLKKADQKEVVLAFLLLTPTDQTLVYQMICKYREHFPLDLHWGKDHVFDRRVIFDCAVSNAIILKYNELSLASRIRTMNKLRQLSGQAFGMEYLFKNLPMLADVMETI